MVVGTRPEIVKMAPVLFALREGGVPSTLVHAGQHYDRELSEVFLEELSVGPPDVSLDVGSGTQGHQTARALRQLEETLGEVGPRLVLVEGDTNTVLAGALAAVKLGIDVGHVEAGLRSRDLRMPEEHNRRLTDHLSSYLYAPTESAAKNLADENVWGEVHITGNTVIDACLQFLPRALETSRVLEEVPFDDFALVTLHRAENVDDPRFLHGIVDAFRTSPIPLVLPLHPRTEKNLRDQGRYGDLASAPAVHLLPPVGYFDMLTLLKASAFILTDSGGIQEEATAPNLRKKVFVLRRTTERPEAVEAGYAEVLGTDPEAISARIDAFLDAPETPENPCPYGDGTAGARIARLVQEALAEGGGPLSGDSVRRR